MNWAKSSNPEEIKQRYILNMYRCRYNGEIDYLSRPKRVQGLRIALCNKLPANSPVSGTRDERLCPYLLDIFLVAVSKTVTFILTALADFVVFFNEQ